MLAVDTLRADRLSLYGHTQPTTPFIDRLGEQGAVFEDVTSQFSWTVPSMISIFTSHYLTGRRVAVDSQERTLPEVFERVGYTTIAAVANVLIQPNTGLARGFDEFIVPKVEGYRGEEWSLDELVERARGPLERALEGDERAPIFLYLHPMEPHDPYIDRDLDGLAVLDETYAVDGWHEERVAQHPTAQLGAADFERARNLRARYDGEVRALDAQVERLFESLDELGLDQNLLFALLSDHGEGLWDHLSPPRTVELFEESDVEDPLRLFYQKHGAIQYQEVVHTPLVLWGRGIRGGQRIRAAVENVDVFPTLIQLAGLGTRRGLDGRSLVPLLRGHSKPPREYVHSMGVLVASIREIGTGLKLIVRLDAIDESLEESGELYDLGRDPRERINLVVEREDDARRLLSALRSWVVAHPVKPGGAVRSEMARQLTALGYTESDVGEL